MYEKRRIKYVIIMERKGGSKVNCKNRTGVIIPAAGSGSRMGNVYKPLEKLCGKEMLCYSLETFQKCEDVAFVVIAAREDKIEDCRAVCEKYGFTKVKKIVKGGDDRQSSVENAFNCGLFDDEEIEYVAIHDAARPMFDLKMARQTFDELYEYSSAVCASRVRDTVKKADDELFITDGVSRDNLWLISTPQIFKKDVYKKALACARENNLSVTDDSSMVAFLGERVHICSVPSYNLKVTYPEDVYLASALINYRNEDSEK